MAMAYDEEDDVTLPLSEPPSPVRPRLKRLKKVSERQPVVDRHVPDPSPVDQTPPPDSSEDPDLLFPESEGLIDELRKERLGEGGVVEDEPLLPDSVEEEETEKEDDGIDPLLPDSFEEDDSPDPLFPDSGGLMEELRKENLKETKLQGSNSTNSEDESLNLEDQDEPDDGLDPLFPGPGEYKAWEGEEDIGEGGLIEELRKEKSAKKCLNFDGGDDGSFEKETKKKKRKSRENVDSTPKESVKEKRRSQKERRIQLNMIHAESQRLLRETSEASFKPIPVVHKPISSVLEKIRLRKMEILNKSSASYQTSEIDSSVGVESGAVESADAPSTQKNDVDLDMDGNGDHVMNVTSSECPLEGEKTTKSHENKEECSEMQLPNSDIGERDTNDKEDKSDNAYTSNGEHNQSESDVAANEVDEVFASSMRTSTAIPSDDVSSSSSDDEEEEEDYNDKENIDPCIQNLPTMDNNDSRSVILKDFVDDEAEEEDDSDHDLERFPENEDEDIDDDGSDELEELKDMIATGYKEGKKDHERRSELHLKWLEQQDVAETDNVLQRLKYSNLQKEDLMDEAEETEDEGEGSEDDAMLSDSGAGAGTGADAGGLKNILRQNSEKVKQMMLFNDDRDVYVPSDEDENEDHMLRWRVTKQPDTNIASLLEDDESREVFGLIKKLNIAPPPKKKANQATANVDILTAGKNSNSFTKFFGRKGSGSMASSRKTVVGRSFIFGRDDSNSRSSLPSDNQSSEDQDQTDMNPKEKKQVRKPISSNMSSSQLNCSIAATSGASSSSGSSLFEILRRSSASSDELTEDKIQLSETQATHIYSAFKVGRGFSRVDARF